eukprot:5656863-Amphidinium_carterae.1
MSPDALLDQEGQHEMAPHSNTRLVKTTISAYNISGKLRVEHTFPLVTTLVNSSGSKQTVYTSNFRAGT